MLKHRVVDRIDIASPDFHIYGCDLTPAFFKNDLNFFEKNEFRFENFYGIRICISVLAKGLDPKPASCMWDTRKVCALKCVVEMHSTTPILTLILTSTFLDLNPDLLSGGPFVHVLYSKSVHQIEALFSFKIIQGGGLLSRVQYALKTIQLWQTLTSGSISKNLGFLCHEYK